MSHKKKLLFNIALFSFSIQMATLNSQYIQNNPKFIAGKLLELQDGLLIY